MYLQNSFPVGVYYLLMQKLTYWLDLGPRGIVTVHLVGEPVENLSKRECDCYGTTAEKDG